MVDVLSLSVEEANTPWFLTDTAWPRIERRLHGAALAVLEDHSAQIGAAFHEAAEIAMPEITEALRGQFNNDLAAAAAVILVQSTLLAMRPQVALDRATRSVTVTFAPRGDDGRRLFRTLRFGTSEVPALDVWSMLEPHVRTKLQPVLAAVVTKFRALLSETLR